MLDMLLRGGTLIDGTGAPGRRADVGIAEGRIRSIGEVDESAREVLDVEGLLVCPGFIDPHTHYDAQILWDPAATPSSLHGVTSIIGGNCGFSLAPLAPGDFDYIARLMSRVEGMPLATLLDIDWCWESFADYLTLLDGNLGVNAGFLVGHCALRRTAMGKRSVGELADEKDLAEMQRLLAESLEAGALGLSTSRAFTHTDGDGEPVPSRWASEEELLALCRTVGAHPGTTLEFMFEGCLKVFSDEEVELMIAMSLAGQRPTNWNVLTVDSSSDRHRKQIAASARAAERGARVVALHMPVPLELCMSFRNYCALFSLPGWKEVLALPLPERMERLRDRELRQQLDIDGRSPEAGILASLARWGKYRIGETTAPENARYEGRAVEEIAREEGRSEIDTLLDIALADELNTVLWPIRDPVGEEVAKAHAELWDSGHVILGGSDAGAHLDRMCGAPYTTLFLAQTLRGETGLSIERAVEMLTQAPAAHFGLRERGLVREGFHADITVIDPESVSSGPPRKVDDLPGGSARLVCDASGVPHVFVGGTAVVREGALTGALPGSLLRSGQDTDTVSIG
ncbi:MAG: aminoacylase [Deltaproteobacteria bacterium]|nr:aminoacylase [Deltaproteobacteria bacterium]